MGSIETFAMRLKEIRLRTGKNQKDFAKTVQSTAATISAYENATKNPSLGIVMNIAEKYNVSIDWLCGLSDKMKIDDTPQTYTDVIDLLVKAENALKFKLNPQHTNCITICDSVMQCFLDDWVKILPLFRDGTVDSELYKLWVDNKKKEYGNVHIGNEDEIEEFLLLMEVLGSPILSKPKHPPDPPQK